MYFVQQYAGKRWSLHPVPFANCGRFLGLFSERMVCRLDSTYDRPWHGQFFNAVKLLFVCFDQRQSLHVQLHTLHNKSLVALQVVRNAMISATIVCQTLRQFARPSTALRHAATGVALRRMHSCVNTAQSGRREPTTRCTPCCPESVQPSVMNARGEKMKYRTPYMVPNGAAAGSRDIRRYTTSGQQRNEMVVNRKTSPRLSHQK